MSGFFMSCFSLVEEDEGHLKSLPTNRISSHGIEIESRIRSPSSNEKKSYLSPFEDDEGHLKSLPLNRISSHGIEIESRIRSPSSNEKKSYLSPFEDDEGNLKSLPLNRISSHGIEIESRRRSPSSDENKEKKRTRSLSSIRIRNLQGQVNRTPRLKANRRTSAALVAQRERHELAILKVEEEKDNENESVQLRSLIGNVAHDLKTPLQAIGMGADDIQNRLKSLKKTRLKSRTGTSDDNINDGFLILSFSQRDAILESTNLISATIAFMSMTINRAIDYTKASHNIELVPSLETIDLDTTLKWPLSIIMLLQGRITVMIEEIPSNICRYVIADKGWLTENVLCLLSNAIKYSNDGSVTVRCRLEEKKVIDSTASNVDDNIYDSASRLCVEIEDTGVGIPPEAREKLFSPFQQAQRMTTGGTG
jgi:signal transduction histidine kinase